MQLWVKRIGTRAESTTKGDLDTMYTTQSGFPNLQGIHKMNCHLLLVFLFSICILCSCNGERVVHTTYDCIDSFPESALGVYKLQKFVSVHIRTNVENILAPREVSGTLEITEEGVFDMGGKTEPCQARFL